MLHSLDIPVCFWIDCRLRFDLLEKNLHIVICHLGTNFDATTDKANMYLE